MKRIKDTMITIGLSSVLCLFGSCSDYLDVSDDLAAELTQEEVFNNVGYARRFHRYIYTGIPDISHIVINSSYAALTGLDNPWPAVSDELRNAVGSLQNLPQSGYHAGNAGLSRWNLYQQIRQANEFLEYAHVIPQQGDQDFIDEEELKQLQVEARFLRAYYHYLLFELYGPIPIMTQIADPSLNELDYARNSVDEVVKFIVDEMEFCYENLAEKELNADGTINTGRAAVPTKGAALAVIAKTWVYAASPLLNGGYKEAVALKDSEGKQLFPSYDGTKWEKALNALQRFIDYAKDGHYHLYKEYDGEGNLDPEESLYQLFQVSINNPEAIWQTSKSSWGGVNSEGREARCTPRLWTYGFSSVGVLQEVIDDYRMSDGLTIEESPLYKEKGIADDGIPNMYKNREPRFYMDITYAGKPWQIVGTKIYFHKGGTDDNSSPNNCHTGALLYKGCNRTLANYGNNKRSQYRASMLFRLADFYLLYAEALNNVNPGDPRIIEYVDSVRYRAGIPLLKDIKPEIKGNQKLQEEAIRHERRIELFAEGQRYFDVRRWMCAEEEEYKQGGPVHGMNMNANNLEDFIERTVLENRIFEPRMYLYPIPQSEIQKSKKLVQNPGW